MSPFLLAAWDPETETLATVCRCMSGFTDVFYAEVSNSILLQLLNRLMRSCMTTHVCAGQMGKHSHTCP